MTMGTTNSTNTFMAVADDCPVAAVIVPPIGTQGPGIARMQYDLLAAHPYELTSDDLLFAVHVLRTGIPDDEQAGAREAFFARSQACLRASPLGKRHGWGIHHDEHAHIALVPLGSARYDELHADGSVAHTRAMRSRRA